MTIQNGYTDLTSLKAAIGIGVLAADTTDDTALEASVEASSRQIDAHCGPGRKFWQDGTVVARYYCPCDPYVLSTDDISTTTGLTVKIDNDGDGVFETTLTINVDFIVEPRNAAAEYPVQPYTAIRLLTGATTTFYQSATHRPVVEVTAKFGWSAVPRAVERACVMQARAIFKAPDTTFGVFAAGIDGQARNIPSLDPVTRALLEPFIRYTDVDDALH